MNLAMLPIGIQGKYRYVQDPMTGEVTDVPNPDISRVDAACMAVPWLFSMGFSILFSALFAKIWRVRMVLKAAARFKRKTVQPKDVAIIMVCVVAIQAVILLCWQLIDPMRWQREIISSDYNGYSTKSVGYCQSNRVLRFLTPLIVIDGMMLLYALHLCFVTRNVSSDLQEGHWITGAVLSIIQILIISIPILIITENNNDAFYFVRSAIIFLMSSTVTALIFFPKMYRLHFARHQRRNATSSAMSRPSVVSQIRASAASASAQRDSLRSFPSNASAQDTGMPARWGNDFQSSNYKASVENNDGVNNDDPGGGNSEVVDDRTRISTQNASSSNDCDTKAVLSERSSSSKALDNGDDDDNTTGDAQAKSCQ